MTTAVVLLVLAIAVGAGLGQAQPSRQHCDESRPKTDKLLIKPRRMGQVGAGNVRNGSNARHDLTTGQCSQESPRAAGPSLPNALTGPLTYSQCSRWSGAAKATSDAEVDLHAGGDGEPLMLGHLDAAVPCQGAAHPLG